MGTSASSRIPRRPTALEQFLAIPIADRFHELIHGQLVTKVSPVLSHQLVEGNVLSLLSPYNRRAQRGRRGGWLIASEVEISYNTRNILRPDIVGWRRDRLPDDLDLDGTMSLRPDWVCEVVSKTNSRRDTVTKRLLYARFGVPHYWIIDPRKKSLAVLQLDGNEYSDVLIAHEGESVRAAPFADTSLRLSRLFGIIH